MAIPAQLSHDTGRGRAPASPDAAPDAAKTRVGRRDGCRRETGAGHALDALSLAIIVVQADHRMLQCNRAARAVLERRDGLVVNKVRLSCINPAGQQALASAIAASTLPGNPRPGAFLLERPEDIPPYQITVAPADGGMAVVMLHDPGADDPSLRSRLRTLYALTVAEADLALALSHGGSVPQIARQRGVSPGTVRFQVKSVAAKMHCRRQTEIAVLVTSLPRLRLVP
jgi:DNA-binding CsgD family transcriptional regulator